MGNYNKDNMHWFKTVLDHIPHGEEGSLECTEDEAITLSKLLIKKGYAVCLTGGDFGDEVRVNWLYAGSDEDLSYADYNNVVFSSTDYLYDWPQAIEYEFDEDEKNNKKEDN